jgi:hypothetical protein
MEAFELRKREGKKRIEGGSKTVTSQMYRLSINYSPHSHSTHTAFSFTVVIVPLVDGLRNKEKMS